MFDKICVEILRHLFKEGKVRLTYESAGRWWSGNEEIDLVAVEGDHPIFAAECKWSKKPVGIDILRDLQRKVSLIAPGGKVADIRLGLFSQSGFTKEVKILGKKKRK